MNEELAKNILSQITVIANQVNSIQENMTNMQTQITQLSIGQMKLSEKIDLVEANLKAEIAEVKRELYQEIRRVETSLRSEFKEELKKLEISLRSEFKEELKKLEISLQGEFNGKLKEVESSFENKNLDLRNMLMDVKEIAEFTKETCETIVQTFEKEHRVNQSKIKMLNITDRETKNVLEEHENRICALEGKRKQVPFV